MGGVNHIVIVAVSPTSIGHHSPPALYFHYRGAVEGNLLQFHRRRRRRSEYGRLDCRSCTIGCYGSPRVPRRVFRHLLDILVLEFGHKHSGATVLEGPRGVEELQLCEQALHSKGLPNFRGGGLPECRPPPGIRCMAPGQRCPQPYQGDRRTGNTPTCERKTVVFSCILYRLLRTA